MKLLLTATSLFPSYGGPAFSVSRLALALADCGVDVGLWASDMSAAQTPLLSPHPRLRALTGSIAGAVERFGTPHIVHDNGIWLAHNHRIAELAAQRNFPRLVSVRGMLEPWALNHKKLKKKLAWWIYQRRDLRRAVFHHATAAVEAKNLKALCLGVPVGVIPNGVELAAVDRQVRRSPAPRIALFVGRLHPVKGLSLLLQAWAAVRPPGWRLHIAGPDEAGYRGALEREVAAANLVEVVRFLGPLDGEAKERAFADAELFVLPSLSESFGVAVGEALARGLPVLTTTGVPWPMIATLGYGWIVPATPEGLAKGLGEATSLDLSALSAMGRKGRDFVQRDFAWPNIAKQFVSAYETLLASRRNTIS